MLYNEFLNNVKCRDNAHNREVYEMLDTLYMNRDDLTKDDIYKSAKSLVDNRLSEREQTLVDEYKRKIEWLRGCIESDQNDIEFYNWLLEERDANDECVKEFKRMKKYFNGCIKEHKESIRMYKKLIKMIEEI